MTASLHTLLWIQWAVVVAVGWLLLGFRGRRYYLTERRQAVERLLRRRYLRWLLFSGEDAPRFSWGRRRVNRRVLCEVMAGLMSTTVGCDGIRLRRVMLRERLEGWLLRRVRWSGGYRRAYWLALLSRLPLDGNDDRRLFAAMEIYRRDRWAEVRFQALCVQIVADPERALHRIGAYPAPFTPQEVAGIVALLRRGILPIAFEPLLRARSANLRRVGVAVVRLYGVEEAEGALLALARTDCDAEVACEALQTLCSMRRPLRGVGMDEALSRRTSTERRYLLRTMARAGYALRTPQRRFKPEECAYYERWVASYKCEIR